MRKLNHNFFETIDTEPKAWLLGFLTTDGSVHKKTVSLNLARTSRPLLEEIKQAIGSDADIWDHETIYNTSKYKHKTNQSSRLSVYSPRMVQDLAKYTIVPNKTKTVAFIQSLGGLTRHYVRGLIDGDGSIYQDSQAGRWYLSLYGTQSICRGTANHIGSILQIQPSLLGSRGSGWEVKYWGQSRVQAIAEHLYGGSTIAHHEKRKKAEQVSELQFRHYHNWSETTLEQLEKMKEQFGGLKEMAAKLGVRKMQLANRLNRLRRLARGIRC